MPKFEQKSSVSHRYYRRVLFAGAGGLLLLWLTWPTPDRIDIYGCSPDGVFAWASAKAYPDQFWRAQLAYVRAEAVRAENWISPLERARSATAEARQRLADFYAANPKLAPGSAQQSAQGLRDRADEIEAQGADEVLSKFMRERGQAAKRCEQTILARLR